MIPNSTLNNPGRKAWLFCLAAAVIMLLAGIISLFCGKYPLSLNALLAGDSMQMQVFKTLRCGRTVMALLGGFALGITGFVYQTIFRNPLASPDIIGVASGASAGAAAGILFFSGAAVVALSSFIGALMAVVFALALSSLDRNGRHSTIVLAGIAVNALAQTVLMFLKLTADPERELASIEYWMMGSLNGISIYNIGINALICMLCIAVLFLLHRQILLLSAREDEARMLGVHVGRLRLIVLLCATLAVSSVISLTGLISFVGLLAPHAARMITRSNRSETMLLSGFFGGILLCCADILARSFASELPVSLFTSLIGAPFLVFLIIRGRRQA